MLRADAIVSKALELGYAKCGIVGIEKMEGYAEKLTERIERFPEVRPFSEDFYAFSHLHKEYPWAKSVVICARWYGKYRIPENVKGHIAKYYLTDSRKDRNSQEYQDSMAFENFLTSSGLQTKTERNFGITSLRWAAMEAGLGIIRKNNFFYTDQGSWIHLEAFLIDQDLEYIHKNKVKACPKNCNLCIQSCPTKSLAEPYMMNRSTCISCLTTWEGWDLTSDPYSKDIGEWIFGCDICQDACPSNRKAWTHKEDFPGLEEICSELSLEQILSADYEFLETVVQPKFWYIPQGKTWRFKTNTLNAMKNHWKPEYLSAVQNACRDDHEEVRRMAEWVLSEIQE